LVKNKMQWGIGFCVTNFGFLMLVCKLRLAGKNVEKLVKDGVGSSDCGTAPVHCKSLTIRDPEFHSSIIEYNFSLHSQFHDC
jgi:hypothetical protein